MSNLSSLLQDVMVMIINLAELSWVLLTILVALRADQIARWIEPRLPDLEVKVSVRVRPRSRMKPP